MDQWYQPDLVVPGLFLSSCEAEQDLRTLEKNSITHILQVGSELSPTHPHSFKYQKIDVLDKPMVDIASHFAGAMHFIDQAISAGVVGDSEYDSYLAGGRVLVHCRAGVSRSATIVIAYQMWKQKVGVKAAVEATRKARWGVMPNPGFLCQLMEYEQLQCDASGWPGWGFCRWLDHPLAAAARQLHDELLFGVDYGGPPLEPETTAYAIGPSRGQVDAPTVRGQEYVAPSLSDNSLQSPFAQLLVAAAAAEDAQPATTAVEDEVQSAL